jgi:hypothetical protein
MSLAGGSPARRLLSVTWIRSKTVRARPALRKHFVQNPRPHWHQLASQRAEIHGWPRYPKEKEISANASHISLSCTLTCTCTAFGRAGARERAALERGLGAC